MSESKEVIATSENIDQLFDGVLIHCEDIGGKYEVPGWKCKACGWTIGSVGLPPPHICKTVEVNDAQRR